MSRPRLLFLCPTLPYPPDRGVALRSYHLLRRLSEHYDVDALLFRSRRDPTQMPFEDRVAHLERFAEVEAFRIPAELNPVRRHWDRIRSLLLHRPEAHWRYRHRAYSRRVLELAFQRDPR